MSTHIVKYKINNENDINKLKDAWTYLEKGNDMTCFQSFFWNQLLAKRWMAFSYNKCFASLTIYTVQDDGNIELIVPVYVQKKTIRIRWWGRKKGIYLLGTETYSDYLNFIYRELNDNYLELLLDTLKMDYPNLHFYLNRVREDSELARKLILDNIKPYHNSVSIYIPLPDTQAAYNSVLSKKTRQNIRTARNRIQKNELNYTIKTFNSAIDLTLAKKLIKLHDARLKKKNTLGDLSPLVHLSRILMTEYILKNERTYNIIRESMLSNKNSFILLVEINSDIAGYLYGIVDKDSIRILQNCLNEQYSYYSPVFLAIYEFINEECILRKYNESSIDFTRGDEDYKIRLGGHTLRILSFII